MKVIIADDSAVVRAILEQKLKAYPDITIIASVSNGKRLLQALKSEKPDVVISDSDMPELDGIKTLISISSDLKLPVLILTDSLSSLHEEKFPCSVDFIQKPKLNSYTADFFASMVEKLRSLTDKGSKNEDVVHQDEFSDSDSSDFFKILCIGASTGGPTAVAEVLKGLGENFPLPILYTQHIEIGADKTMAEWFCSVCPNIKVHLAKNGEEALPGVVYMAPADLHLEIDYVRQNGTPILKLSDEQPERFLRPAVNKLFRSAALHYGKHCLALLLTGMGMDGAEGCKKICDRGGKTIVEDKSTCVVFGMPAAAIEMGAAKEILPRPQIPKRVLELVMRHGSK